MRPFRREDASATRVHGQLRQWVTIAIVALGLAHCAFHFGYTIDDAYITFRYARNLVHGLGLVYNAGEYVKGYSNTLLTLLSTIPLLFSVDPAGFAKACSLGCYIALLFRLARQCVSGPASLATLGIVAASAPVAVWFVAGLETGIYATLLVFAVLRRLSEQENGGGRASGFLFSLVVLSRPEGILFWLVAAAHDLIFRPRLRTARRPDLVFYLLPLLCAAAEVAASYAYYGSPLPQTYHAKVASTFSIGTAAAAMLSGALVQISATDQYLLRSLRVTFGDTLFVILGLAAIALAARHRLRINAMHWLMVTSQVLFIGISRTDWMPAGRFLVPLLPFLAALVGEGLATICARRPRVQWLFAATVIALIIPTNSATSRSVHEERRLNAAAKLADGRAYARLVAAGAALSTFDIGGQGYEAATLDVVDTYGLTDRYLARCGAQREACRLYGALVRPELVRRHVNGKGAFVPGAIIKREYVALSHHGDVRVARSEVFPADMPSTAVAAAADFPSHVRLERFDAPRFVRKGREFALHLYWRKTKENATPGCGRRVELRDARGAVRARGRDWVWCYGDGRRAWRRGIFDDYVVLDAISAAEALTLWVEHAGHSVSLGRVEVLESSAAEKKALELLTLAVDDSSVARRFRLLNDANAISTQHMVRAAYQRASVAYAKSLLPTYFSSLPPEAQIRALRVERRVLVQTAWEVPMVGDRLRRAIDTNAARRTRLIDRLISSAKSSTQTR